MAKIEKDTMFRASPIASPYFYAVWTVNSDI